MSKTLQPLFQCAAKQTYALCSIKVVNIIDKIWILTLPFSVPATQALIIIDISELHCYRCCHDNCFCFTGYSSATTNNQWKNIGEKGEKQEFMAPLQDAAIVVSSFLFLCI